MPIKPVDTVRSEYQISCVVARVALMAVLLEFSCASGSEVGETSGSLDSAPLIVKRLSSLDYANVVHGVRLQFGISTNPEALKLIRPKVQSEDWIKRVLDSAWAPPKNTTMLFLPGQSEGPDIVCVGWRVGSYHLETSQTATVFVLKIAADEMGSFGTNSAQKADKVRELCGKMFSRTGAHYDDQGNKLTISELASQIADWSVSKGVTKTQGEVIYHSPGSSSKGTGLQPNTGSRTGANWTDSQDALEYWFRHVYWWNNGKEVVFYFPKLTGKGSVFSVGPMSLPSFESSWDKTYFTSH